VLAGSTGETPLEPFGRSPPGPSRAPAEVRARRRRGAKIGFVPHPSFDDPAMHALILGPAPAPSGVQAARRFRRPAGISPYLTGLEGDPLLTREQELHLFRKMNFLKHRAVRFRGEIDPAGAQAPGLDLVEALQGEALAVKNQIIRANLRLVVSTVKKLIRPGQDFAELVSDGTVALIVAIEKFDFSRGYKFSTYASWAIRNNVFRSPLKQRRRDRFFTGHEAMLADAPDHRNETRPRPAEQEGHREAIQRMLGRLGDRERTIIVARFGLEGAREKTLGQLGKELGISKERVRQLEFRARGKLRALAEEQALDLLAC
jgi:RNA polymerase primary sigma factor